jgi:hypothetical protein
MVRPHVCYAALAAAPWLALAGAGTALCGLLACAHPGQAAAGGAALAAASGAWLLAWGLLWAHAAPRRPTWAGAIPGPSR